MTEPFRVDPSELKVIIADYMEKGFLENIVDMFKHDAQLYEYIADIMKDERLRVRIGISALVETLAVEDPEHILKTIPSIAYLLKDQSPVIRSDAAYLLGVIRHRDSLPFLRQAINDEDATVRTIAKEAIEEIELGIVKRPSW
ncbi:MAG: HEAT repeat domain-containing protein [Nitrospira sp.]|nr:HEAT repeat domain-containing protein [Nitrospira sp.]